MSKYLKAPWTRGQVATLNEFQHSGLMHPLTCGQRDQHPHNEGVLLATRAGWRCPAYGCRYVQDWAHWFMADRSAWPKPWQPEPERSPEQEIVSLQEELAAMRRKLGSAKADAVRLRKALEGAEDELARLRQQNTELHAQVAAAGVYARNIS